MRLEAKVALAVLDGVARVRIARADSVVAVSELVRRERPRVRKYKGILTTENRSWFLGGKQTRDTCAGRERNRRGTIQSLWLPSGRDRRADSQRSIVPRGESELVIPARQRRNCPRPPATKTRSWPSVTLDHPSFSSIAPVEILSYELLFLADFRAPEVNR
jgi:hypothetical protein